ncbi:hypothetical protein LTR37_001625 [Vermiconidia calcicola]|uniref:Uncharacterized protein n=1 Tax=Vermiconidia calcicola TaxID=1690605 RepID=A0ACC3NV90_9PEZI|nr:hypothetical protein LTR37_001625 [Vermiconidia calcicola]
MQASNHQEVLEEGQRQLRQDRQRRPRPQVDPYANTSLEEPSPPPREPTRDAQLEAAQDLEAERLTELHMARDREEAEDFEMAEAARRANRESDKLRDLWGTFDAKYTLLKDVQQQLKTERPNEYAAFVEHAANVMMVAKTNVRQYDMLRWYRRLPHYVFVLLKDVSVYYHEEVHRRSVLHKYEKKSGSWADGLQHEEELYAAQRYKEEDFGFENLSVDQHDNPMPDLSKSFLAYPHHTSEEAKSLKYREASFEVRKVRVEHGQKHERYPAHSWSDSLDEYMVTYVANHPMLRSERLMATSPGSSEHQELLNFRSLLMNYAKALTDRRDEHKRLIRNRSYDRQRRAELIEEMATFAEDNESGRLIRETLLPEANEDIEEVETELSQVLMATIAAPWNRGSG